MARRILRHSLRIVDDDLAVVKKGVVEKLLALLSTNSREGDVRDNEEITVRYFSRCSSVYVSEVYN